MKRFNLFSVAIALVLMVTAVSCTTMRETEDDYYYDRTQTANRIYVDDPYRGTIVLERDPYSGRYYEVSPYSRYSSPYGTSRRNNPYYGRRNNTYYGRNNNNYRNNNTNVYQTPQKPTEGQIREREKNRDDARKKILGN